MSLGLLIFYRGKTVGKELPVRKNIRLSKYDYSKAGYYFVTICVQDGHELLGQIVGGGVLDAPHVQVSNYGAIVEKHILAINEHYKDVSIEKYIVMPNHVHMLVFIRATKEDGASRTPPPTGANAYIPRLISTLKRFVHKDCGFKLFQRNFHDHIIRNEKEYQKIWQYIDSNPANWEEDCYRTK